MSQNQTFTETVASLSTTFQKQSLIFNRGIERESLRVDANGNLALTPHPAFLGSKLCHPLITTDFSESQLELITPVSQSIDETLTTLNDIHRFVYSELEDEVLWAASMPCVLQGDRQIPLANYGSSNLAKLKTTYRNGLGNRYGRSMQTICAVHYNFSFPDALWQDLAQREGKQNSATFRTARYFDLMRNFRRLSWLPIYLFGASPAVCNSFVKHRQHNLTAFDNSSLFSQGATSLRNGNLGYQSDAQSGLLNICYNSMDSYVEKLANAITTPYAAYTDLGLKNGTEYLQVNDSIIQSEAEFYTTIRAKCVPAKGTNFLTALMDGGVEYIEVRLLDVNPFHSVGIDQHTMRFLDAFLLYCLLIDSPAHDDQLCNDVKINVDEMVLRGRQPNARLTDQGVTRSVQEWGNMILEDVSNLGKQLDQVAGHSQYDQSIGLQTNKLNNPQLTPSAQILSKMEQQGIPFFRFAMNQTLEHKARFQDQPLSADEHHYFQALASASIKDQSTIEQQPQQSFDQYLKELNEEYQQIAQ